MFILNIGLALIIFGIFCIWFSIRKERQLDENRRLPERKRHSYRKAERCPQCNGWFYGRYKLVLCYDHKKLKEYKGVENGQPSL